MSDERDVQRQKSCSSLLPNRLRRILCSGLVVICLGTSAAASRVDDTSDQLAQWDHTSSGTQRAQLHHWVDTLVDQLSKAANERSNYSEIIYGIQLRTNNILKYAFDNKEIEVLVRLANLYILPLDYLQETSIANGLWTDDRSLTTWIDQDGRMRPLTSSQFLYLIAYFVRRTEELSDTQRLDIFDRLAIEYAPILRDHLDYWIFGEPGMFGVPQECHGKRRYSHSAFIKMRREKKFGEGRKVPPHCHSLRDLDLWIIATAAETTAAIGKNKEFAEYFDFPDTELEAHIHEGVSFFFERLRMTELGEINGRKLFGLDFDTATWLERPEHRYSGYSGSLFPEDNSRAPTLDPSFEADQIRAWRVSRDGVVSKVAVPAFTGQTALRVDVDEDETITVSQVVPVSTSGRIRAYFHTHGSGAATIAGTLHIDERIGRVLRPAETPTDGWERLEITLVPSGFARTASLELRVTGPGHAIIDEARIVPIDEGAASSPSVSVDPVVGTGSWDISHARRLVQWLDTFDDLQLVSQPWTAQELKSAFARQIAYAVFNGDFRNPGFSNYLDGTNGWYRVNYVDRIGFGYAPGQLSSAIINGGYCQWSMYDERLAQICATIWDQMKNDPKVSPSFTYCSMSKFTPVPCSRLSERAMNLVAGMGIVPQMGDAGVGRDD